MVRALTKTHCSWDPHTNKPTMQCCLRLLLHIAQSNQRALFWVEWSGRWPKHTAVGIYTLLCNIHLQVTTTWSESQSEGSISLLPWRLWCHKRNLAGKGAFSCQNHFLRVRTFGNKVYCAQKLLSLAGVSYIIYYLRDRAPIRLGLQAMSWV